MGQQTTLIVGDRSPATESLSAILTDEKISVAVVRPHQLREWLTRHLDRLGFVLVSASLTMAEVRELGDVVAAHVGRMVEIVIFAETSAAELDRHVRMGSDYLIPPFHPDVLRRRRIGHSADTVRAVADATHLAQYEKELQIGREIQAGFLPETLPAPAGWQIEVRFHAARQVAGDFYDAFNLVNGRRVGFVVADVCDKGVGAALFMALIRSLLRNTASHSGSGSIVGLNVEWDAAGRSADERLPSATAAGVMPLLNAVVGTDQYMIQNHLRQGYFATLFFGILDPATGLIVYINCGHNPPVVRRSDGRQIMLQPTGPALGMLTGSSFRLGSVQLERGDLLYIYTDGVTEAKNESGAFFTEAGMRSVIEKSGTQDARHLLEDFDRRLHTHVGDAEQFDDITMMAIHRPLEPIAAMGPTMSVSQRPEDMLRRFAQRRGKQT